MVTHRRVYSHAQQSSVELLGTVAVNGYPSSFFVATISAIGLLGYGCRRRSCSGKNFNDQE
jgi:hypothetical protein